MRQWRNSTLPPFSLAVLKWLKRFKSYVLSECRDQLMVSMAHSDETKHFGAYVRFAFSHG